MKPFRKLPNVGVGVVITHGRKILMIRRNGAHGGGTWSTPGGYLEMGETPEQCAAREAQEETGIRVKNVEFLAMTNDRFKDGKHFITIWMKATPVDSRQISVNAPDELTEVGWYRPDALPKPLFSSLRNLLSGKTYPRRRPRL